MSDRAAARTHGLFAKLLDKTVRRLVVASRIRRRTVETAGGRDGGGRHGVCGLFLCASVGMRPSGGSQASTGVMLVAVRRNGTAPRASSLTAKTTTDRHPCRIDRKTGPHRNSTRKHQSGTNIAFMIGRRMLQQILLELYVEPELLSELDEEQKQILFCKMREEQVRRWKLREENLPPKRKPAKQKKSARRVTFRRGADGETWVWLMGEHRDDRSVEQMLEEEEKTRAEQLAGREAEALRKQEEAALMEKIREEQAAEERERVEKERELKRKEEEAARHQSMKEAKAAAERVREERRHEDLVKQQRLQSLKLRHDRWRRLSQADQAERTEKRSSQIFLDFREARHRFEKAAVAGSLRLEADWQEQERRSRLAQAERKTIARQARKEVTMTMRLARTESQLIDNLDASIAMTAANAKTDTTSMFGKKAVIRRRMSVTLEKEAIVSWFQKEEVPRGSGQDPLSRQMEPWFHGIITRPRAESLLADSRPGTFLVRVSERVTGYAVSYRGANRYKHYLIDTSSGAYQFFGTYQVTHTTLGQLIAYHKNNPISCVGQEFLLHPCVQQGTPPDYAELFIDK